MKTKQVLIALDQLVNTLCNGMADETMSARAWRNRESYPRVVKAINFLFRDPNHCEDSYKSEVTNQHLPPEYKD